MAKAGYILAIDQGTTGTTVAVVDSKGKIQAKTNTEYKQIYPKPGWVEHRPDDIWKSVTDMISKCLKKSGIKAQQIEAIGITNQRETVVVWDRKTSKVVHNAIVWQDRRTTDFCENLKRAGHEEMLKRKTGLVIDPYFSASKLNWLSRNVNGLKAKMENGSVAAGTIDAFLIWRLTGGLSHKTDISNASRTQLMNLHSGMWDQELLELFAIPEKILPQIIESNGEFGVTKGLKVLPDGIPIRGVAGDQQAALFGQTCFETGESKCTFGTGSFLLMNTGTQAVSSNAGLLTTAAWKLKGKSETIYALEGGAFICGAAVQFLRDQMGFIKTSGEIEKLAKTVKSAEGVEFVPALVGLGAPHWKPEARGLISGLTRGSTRGHIARATLDAMALQNTEILLAMQKDLNQKLKSMRVDGGASANNFLMQIQSDYLGTEVVRPQIIETTVAGAAYLAGLGAGVWSDLSDIKKVWKVEKLFTPKVNASERTQRLEIWKKAVDRAKL
jgi:glycerol kinase